MEDKTFFHYVQNLMQHDIAKAIPYDIDENEIKSFSSKVLDRFRNPFLQHKWLNITLQNTMKMRNRNVPVLLQYQRIFDKSPEYMATGFAGYLLFMKVVKKEGNIYYGQRENEFYVISDDKAEYYYQLWQQKTNVDDLVESVLSDKELWDADLSSFESFKQSVKEKLSSMIAIGVRNTIENI